MVVHLLLLFILFSVSFVSAVEDEARNKNNSPEISLRIPTRPSSEHNVRNIPTKKRTPNRTRPSSKFTSISDNKDEKPQIGTSSKEAQQTSGKRPAGYYSIEQHAIRIAKSPRFRNSIGGQTTYEERLRLAKEKLSSKKFKDNQNISPISAPRSASQVSTHTPRRPSLLLLVRHLSLRIDCDIQQHIRRLFCIVCSAPGS